MASKSEALQVYIRVRPPIYQEVKEDTAVTVPNNNTVVLNSDKGEITCSYDNVFNEITEQEDIFNKVKPLLVDVLSGINSCIFAYGQTSAGKSYTMIGPDGGNIKNLNNNDNNWGIIPRSTEFLLNYLNEKSNEGILTYEVKASFLQIYNENLYDLLRDSKQMFDTTANNKDYELRIREVPIPKSKGHKKSGNDNEVYISGLSEFRVETSDDILRILAVGTNNRMTRSTDFNKTSSRSHAILTLTFEIESQSDTGQTIINKSKLNLIDLAGSEKIPFNNVDVNNPKHMKELTSINKSLSCLGNVIAALSSNNRSHIPYRDSKLTRILQDSLSGNTRTILIACLAPTMHYSSETLSTLQFADRAKNVMLTVKPNTLVDDKFLLAKAHAEITRLKTLLAHALKQVDQLRKAAGKSNGSNNGYISDSDTEATTHNNYNNNNNRGSREKKSNGIGFRDNSDNEDNADEDDDDTSDEPRMRKSHISDNSFTPKDGKGSKSTPKVNKGLIRNNNNKLLDTKLLLKGAVSNSKTPVTKKKKKKAHKKKEAADVVLDLMETQHNGSEAGKLQKAINERQIEELNSVLSNASHQMEQQQQQYQAMQHYLMQQQLQMQQFMAAQQKMQMQYLTIGQQQVQEQMKAKAQQQTQPTVQTKNIKTNDHNRFLPPVGAGGAGKPTRPRPLPPPPAVELADTPPQSPKKPAEIRQNRERLKKLPPEDDSNDNNSPTTDSPDESKATSNKPQSPATTIMLTKNRIVRGSTPSNVANRNNNNNNNNNEVEDESDYEEEFEDFTERPKSKSHNKKNSTIVGKDSANIERSGSSKESGSISILAAGARQGDNFLLAKKSDDKRNSDKQVLQPLVTTPQPQKQTTPVHRKRPKDPNQPTLKYLDTIKSSDGGSLQKVALLPIEPTAIPSAMHRPAELLFSHADIGRSLQLFSFRMNSWDRIDLVDYEPTKRLHKCRHPDGSIQWLDLAKKPVRSLPES